MKLKQHLNLKRQLRTLRKLEKLYSRLLYQEYVAGILTPSGASQYVKKAVNELREVLGVPFYEL